MDELLTKAQHSADSLLGDLREAYKIAKPESLVIVLEDMLVDANRLRDRLYRLACVTEEGGAACHS